MRHTPSLRTTTRLVTVALGAALNLLPGIVIGAPGPTSNAGAPAPPDTEAIDQIVGRSGELRGDVYKVGFPRTDLRVVAAGVEIKPGPALGSWMAFEGSGDHAVAMGDLVLLQSEINPMLGKLEANGIEISAIHNHLLEDTPHVMYMHFWGNGDAETIARALKAALGKTNSGM